MHYQPRGAVCCAGVCFFRAPFFLPACLQPPLTPAAAPLPAPLPAPLLAPLLAPLPIEPQHPTTRTRPAGVHGARRLARVATTV